MSDLEEPWTDIKSYLLLFSILLNNMLSFSLIKKKNLLFSLSTEYYFFLFFIFLSNFFLKITSVIDLTATHYIDNITKDFELLYVNIFYKLNFRFFFKIFLKKEDLIVSISELFKSTAWFEREV
jgi:NADH:ubiquinone oxidoreductase subunit C